MAKVYNVSLPDHIKTEKDPHHAGFNEWTFFCGNWYIRNQVQNKWTKVKKVHLTPARLKTLLYVMNINGGNNDHTTTSP